MIYAMNVRTWREKCCSKLASFMHRILLTEVFQQHPTTKTTGEKTARSNWLLLTYFQQPLHDGSLAGHPSSQSVIEARLALYSLQTLRRWSWVRVWRSKCNMTLTLHAVLKVLHLASQSCCAVAASIHLWCRENFVWKRLPNHHPISVEVVLVHGMNPKNNQKSNGRKSAGP